MDTSEKPFKRKVIVITDGDQVARRAVELAGKHVGGRVISRSAGNPTPLNGEDLVSLIQEAKNDPVLVMFDDNGDGEEGFGEEALRYVASHPSIEILGALAVASHTPFVEGTLVDYSIDAEGNWIQEGVDKDGIRVPLKESIIMGDTVDVLREISCPITIGIGDPGKMKGKDSLHLGAPITTAAIQKILTHSFVEPVEDTSSFGIVTEGLS